MADFITELKKVYNLEKQIAELEASRNLATSVAGQKIAAKQGELTTAKQALLDTV